MKTNIRESVAAVAVTVALIAPAAASAGYQAAAGSRDGPPPPSQVYVPWLADHPNATAPPATAPRTGNGVFGPSTPFASGPVEIGPPAANEGFDWNDASVGAATAAGAVLFTAAAAMVIQRKRKPHIALS